MNMHRKALAAALALAAGLLAAPAVAVDRITIGVVNERAFTLSIELRDMNCGGNVVLREQLEAGEKREIQICANAQGVGRLGASYGSGCSQVKRTNFDNVEAGSALTF